MLGISVKLWQLCWDSQLQQFVTSDTCVFVFQDRGVTDLDYIQTVLKHLAGDNSVDDVIESLKTLKSAAAITAATAADEEVKKQGTAAAATSEEMVKIEMEESRGAIGHEDDEVNDQDDCDNDKDDYNEDDCDDGREDDNDYNEEEEKEEEIETCEACGEQFRVWSLFRKHLQHCHPEQLQSLLPKFLLKLKTKSDRSEEDEIQEKVAESCGGCEKKFRQRSLLIRHLRECNPPQILQLVQGRMSEKVAGRIKSILSRHSTLSCSFCPRKFSMKDSLEKHEHLHKTDPDNPKLGDLRYRKYNLTKRAAPPGHFQCERCVCSFTLECALERHMEAHTLADNTKTEEDPADSGLGLIVKEVKDGVLMRCVRCDLAYRTRIVYLNHMNKHHKKALSCEQCSKTFTLPSSLNRHRLIHHTSFPKDCDDCGHHCPTKRDFLDHVREQHGFARRENTVPCEVCGKLMKSKHNLEIHVKHVHENRGFDFPCKVCGKVLKSKYSLKYHTKVHTGDYKFSCDECGHGYMRYEQVVNCKNTHRGIFKFHCPHCDYKSNNQQVFSNHVTTHSIVKPWMCPVCQFTSANTNNLHRHTKKVHNMTLCQAEAFAKRSRSGKAMTEADLEHNRVLTRHGASNVETKEMYSASQKETFKRRMEESFKRRRARSRKNGSVQNRQSPTLEHPELVQQHPDLGHQVPDLGGVEQRQGGDLFHYDGPQQQYDHHHDLRHSPDLLHKQQQLAVAGRLLHFS